MYIVLEYLLLENFIINYLILYLTKVLNRKDSKNKRLILSSVLASLYSLCYFYPGLLILTTFPAKLLFSLLIIRISFKFVNYRFFIKEVMSFYIISFAFAGATMGVFFSSNSYLNTFDKTISYLNRFSWKHLLLGIILSFIIVKAVFKFYNIKIIRENFIVDVKILFKENWLNIKALLDTGNSLIDPLTNYKVLIVEYDAVRNILPSKTLDLIKANENNNYTECERILTELQGQIKLHLIPFKSIGKSGTIFCFKPDIVEINYMDKTFRKKDVLIGIYTGSLSKEMGYSGLLHYELINGGMEYENIEIQAEDILL